VTSGGARVGPALLALVLALPVNAQEKATGPIRPRTTYEDLQMLSGVLNQIRVNHPDSQDTHGLIMAAIEGLVREADPHSFVIPAIRLNPEKEKALRDGKLYPVPVTFTFFGGSPVVNSVAPGSSAAKTDILPGDELVAIDRRPVSAASAEELDIVLAGPKNSTITLTFERRRVDGTLVQLERVVKRERPGEASAVPAAFMLDQRTGYVRVTTFVGEKVADDVHDALSRLEREGMERLVLDLRDNGGGSVEEASKIAGEFLPKGAIIYTAEGRKEDIRDTARVGRSFWRSEKRYPIVVMVNSGSASASELVAGALQDHDRALIVGRPSFGKSLLMRGFPLPDGSVLVMVIGHLRTPCGRVIQRQYRGVTRHDYYRLARAARDTAGRPSCKTAGGRTAYGGGGIFPDIVLSEPQPTPLWLARVYEEALLLKWTPGYLSANGGAFASLESFARNPVLPADALTSFRAFAAEQNVAVPTDPGSEEMLRRAIARWAADTKWGDAGLYRLTAVLDPEVKSAVEAFAQAEKLKN
jgi:carboxyl-terminal processing protease